MDAGSAERSLDRVEAARALDAAPPPRGRVGVDHDAAADRLRGLRIAHDETIARSGADRFVENELRARRGAAAQHVALERNDVRDAVRRTEVHVQRRPVGDRRGIRQQTQAHVDALRRHERVRIGKPVAACDRRPLDAREIERAALARAADLAVALVGMQCAHARRKSRRHDLHHVADAHLARMHGAGRDRAVPGQREHAVDRESEQALRGASRLLCRCRVQVRAQRRHAFVFFAARVDGEAWRASQRAIREQRVDLAAHVGDALGIHAIGLGQRDRALRDPEQLDDREVLARLRHHAVVRGHDEQGEIDAARTSDHRVHEAFVPRHVDEAEHRAVRERYVRVAELDRDAALQFRFLGMSGILPDLPDHIAMGVFDVFQIPYSVVQREHEELIAAAAQSGAGTLIRGGAARGAPSADKRWRQGPSRKRRESASSAGNRRVLTSCSGKWARLSSRCVSR